MSSQRIVAVVANPTKISDRLRRLITEQAGAEADIRWLETTEDDPGRRMTADAIDQGADVVLAAGGDGTVRVVAAGLAGSGVPLGVIPEGTANLLARNLGIPLQEEAAVEVALGALERTLDVISVAVDADEDTDRFAVMAGIGLDAAIMSNTDETLKKRAGSVAYVVSGLQQLGRRPRRMKVTVDDRPTVHRKAMICLVGNVSAVQGDLELVPGAQPDDGLLDVVIASPRRLRHWLMLVVALITRRPHDSSRLDQIQGRRVVIELDESEEYQLDGDTVGSCRRLTAEIEPGALRIRAPQSTT